jgi:hypothetical protein
MARQEYLSWGNNGIEDYADMTGAFPQGPWLPVYLVWASTSENNVLTLAQKLCQL